jgi:hypothetical protein
MTWKWGTIMRDVERDWRDTEQVGLGTMSAGKEVNIRAMGDVGRQAGKIGREATKRVTSTSI